MGALLYKEIKLNIHVTNYLFLLLNAMLLIPNYPYYVTFFYTCLGINFVFLSGRENKDVLYSMALPVRKRDCVKARCSLIAIIQLTQLLVSIPFAILGSRINPNPLGNGAGIEANVAFYGLSLIMFAIFNLWLIPRFYRTAYNIGKPFLFSCIIVFLYIGVVEVAVQAVPLLKQTLDTSDPAMQLRQLPILAAGIIIYALGLVLAYKRAAANFERVDL